MTADTVICQVLLETAEGSLGCRIRVVQRGFYFAPIFFRDKGDFFCFVKAALYFFIFFAVLSVFAKQAI